MEKALHIRLFGGLTIEVGEEPVSGLVTQKAEVLVAYLACQPRAHSREKLATMLWDDREQKQALSNLRTLLTSLRRHLKPFLNITRQQVSLVWEPAAAGQGAPWVDVTAFEQALDGVVSGGALDEAGCAALEQALALYTGEFLDGVFVSESHSIEMWMVQMRERLQRRANEARWQLANEYLHRRQYDKALPHAEAMVHSDGLSERGHRLLMRLLARSGRHAAALAQFEKCRELLAQELGVEPEGETVRLRDQIAAARRRKARPLPGPQTPFVGRTRDLAQASRMLDDRARRLVTIVGEGGVGKTRLALAIAAERNNDYLHGVAFVPLAQVEDGSGLALAIAQSLEAAYDEQKSVEEQLASMLQTREMLLVLDNFEQLVEEGAGLVRHILDHAPEVQLLVTSRHRLQLQAEWLMRLEGLATGDGAAAGGQDGPYAPSDAERLFELSARRLRHEFRLTQANMAAVSAICRLVSGLPLAIELAAGTLHSHDAAQAAREIRHSLDFLASEMHDTPPRQRSLRAAFEHSWGLLPGDGRRILAQLAVFRGAFDAAAASAVAGTSRGELRDLCARSLLRQHGAGRFSLHEALHPYALEKLEGQAGEASATRARHATYYGDFLKRLEADLDGGAGQLAATEAVNGVWENVAAGWRWAAETVARHEGEQGQKAALLQRYLRPLNQWLTLRGLYREGQALFSAAVAGVKARRERIADGDGNAALASLLGHLLSSLGFFQFRLMALGEAAESLQAAVELAQQLEDAELALKPSSGLANIAFRQGNYDEAKRRYEQALALSMQLEQTDRIAAGLEGLALVANFQGDLPEALRLLQESVALHREVNDRHALANALGNLAATLGDAGRLDEAIAHFEESVELWRQLGDNYTLRIVLENMGEVVLKTGDFDDAQAIFEESLDICRREGYTTGYSYWGLGEVQLSKGAYEQAETYLRQALASYGSDYERLRALLAWARLAARTERENEAARLLRLVREHATTAAIDRATAQQELARLQERGHGEGDGATMTIDMAIDSILKKTGSSRKEAEHGQ